MNQDSITVHVKMDARTFRRFSCFDTFLLTRRWIGPLLFAVIFVAFSIIAFLSGKEDSGLIGWLLLLIGVGMPGTWVLNFHLQLNAQIRRLQLKTPRPVYSLELGDKKITVTNDMKKEAKVTLPWKSLMGVWRVKDAFYLYAAQNRAFILPDGQANATPAELYDFAKARLPEGALHGKRP